MNRKMRLLPFFLVLIFLFLNACSTMTIPPEEFAIIDLNQPINVVLRSYEDEKGNGGDDARNIRNWLTEVADKQDVPVKFVFYEFPREPKNSINPTFEIFLANWQYDNNRYKCTLLGKIIYEGKETGFSAFGKDSSLIANTVGKNNGFHKCAIRATEKLFKKFLSYTNYE